MTEISAAAQIDASPENVWAILADLASYPQWNPLFRAASGQLAAGSTLTLKTVRPGTERIMSVKVKVLAAEPASKPLTRPSSNELNTTSKQRRSNTYCA